MRLERSKPERRREWKRHGRERCKIERGVLDARLSTLNKLAAAYGVSVSTLLRNV